MAKPRRRNPSNKQLVSRLEKAATNASKRSVYSVKKQNDTYCVIDYLRGNVVFDDIPVPELAKTICEKYNNKKPVDKEVHGLIKSYYKHYTDIEFYLHTYKVTDDAERKAILSDRIGVSKGLLRGAKRELLKFS